MLISEYNHLTEEELLSEILMDPDISSTLISAFGNVRSLVMDSSVEELQSTYNVDNKRASQIRALRELGKRLYRPPLKAKIKISSPKDAYDLVFMDLAYEAQKHFGVLLLDSKSQVIYREIVSVGTIGFALLDSRLVFNPAIRRGASRVIIYTNGLSGICSPEPIDIDLSKKMVEAGVVIGIPVADLIMITPGGYYSFKEKGLL